MKIKTTQEIIEKAFLKDYTFSVSSTDKDRIHFSENDVGRLKEWVALDELIKKVEWLKEQIMPNQKIKEFTQWQIIDLIDKAFEDVVRKE